MKQIYLALFLISLSAFSCKLMKSRFISKTRSNQFSEHASFSIRGNLSIIDVGSSLFNSWICATNGTILKSSTSALQLILTNSIKGDCLSIDVDYTGFPWVVTKSGSVFQLKLIHDNSAHWSEIYKGENGKAIDIGCNQFNTTSCFIAVENSKEPFIFSQGTFIKSLEFSANSKIKRIDVGHNGGVYVVNEDNYVLQLRKNQNPLSLGLIANDVSVGLDNNLYATTNNGVYLLTRCSRHFVKIHSIYAQCISVGSEIWLVGKDNFAYKGSTFPYVNDC